MRLKHLIKYLENKSPDAVAIKGFGTPHSYRGWYEQLAFAPTEKTTAEEMLRHAKSALGKTFYGWKGGEYQMNGDTFVNIANHGECGDNDEITEERLDAMFTQLSDDKKDIINFLLGESDIDDVWFGDRHPTEKGQFWWRNRLRKAFQDADYNIKEPT